MHSTLDIFYQIFILFLSLLHIFSLFTSLNVLSAVSLSVFLNHFLLFFPASYFFLYAVFLLFFNPLLLALPLFDFSTSFIQCCYLFSDVQYLSFHVLFLLLVSRTVLVFLLTQFRYFSSHITICLNFSSHAMLSLLFSRTVLIILLTFDSLNLPPKKLNFCK